VRNYDKIYIGGDNMIFVIYEDEVYFRTILKNEIDNILSDIDVKYKIIFAKSSYEVLNYNNSPKTVINIIDIEHEDEMNKGIITAKEIRENFDKNFIIFFTSHIEKTYDVLNSFIEPLAYVYKGDPNFSKILEDAIIKIFKISNEKNKNDNVLFKDANGDSVYLDMNDIHFITTSPDRQKYLDVYLYDNRIEVKGILKDLSNFSERLIQISRSTLVNKSKIRNIMKDDNPKNKIIITGLKDKDVEKLCVLTPKYKNKLS
jgi:DNA-binding LytR/AlgR family response regulator